MPYYPQPNYPLIPALASAAAGYVQAQQQQQNDALQRQWMQQQMSESAQKAALEQQMQPYQIQALQAQTKGATAEAGERQAETDYYKQEIASDIASSNLKPPTALLNRVANATDLNSRLNAYGALEAWYRNQPGGETVADKLMQYQVTAGSSLARTQIMPVVANIGASARDYAADQATDRAVQAAEIGGRYRLAGDTISAGFKAGANAFTGYVNLDKDIRSKMASWTNQNRQEQAKGNNQPYPNIENIEQSATNIIQLIQTGKYTQKQIGQMIDTLPAAQDEDGNMVAPNDAEKGYLRDIARQAFDVQKQSDQATAEGKKLTGLSGDISNILQGLNAGGGATGAGGGGGGGSYGTGNPYR